VLLKTLACELLDRRRRFRVKDVDVEGWRRPRQNAGIARRRSCPRPALDLMNRGFELLPFIEEGLFADAWHRDIAVAQQLGSYLFGDHDHWARSNSRSGLRENVAGRKADDIGHG